MVIVPDELVPRWRDLGALAWLATRKLGGPIVAVPVLGWLACVAAWPPMAAVLTRARAQRTLAAHDRHALIAVRTNLISGSWHHYAIGAAAFTLAAAAYTAAPLIVLLAAAFAEVYGAHRLAAVLAGAALPVLLLIGALAMTCLAPGLRTMAPAQRRHVRDLAAQRGVAVVEAAGLAADDITRRAATVLVRTLVRHIDALQVAVMACPRDDRVAMMYQRLGFQLIDHRRARIMVRWPGHRRSTAARQAAGPP